MTVWKTLRARRRTGQLCAAAIAAMLMSAVSMPLRAAGLQSPPQSIDEVLLLDTARRYFPGETTAAPPKRLFRLTRQQLDATVASLLPGLKLPSVKSFVDRDPLQTNYEYAEILSFNSANTQSVLSWTRAVSAAAGSAHEQIARCAVADDTCHRAFARNFATRAFRGDVETDKLDIVSSFYADGVKSVGPAQSMRDLVEIVLNSPDFLFRKELSTDRSRRLSPAQLLQALTYTLADAPPDQIGFDSRQPAQALSGASGGDALLDKIVTSKEAREKLVRFFKSWLEIRNPNEFTISTAIFPEFDDKLQRAMLDEADRYLRQHLSEGQPRLSALTQGTSTAVSPALAKIYGPQVSAFKDGQTVTHDATQRLGVFSLPAVLASHSGPTNSRLVKRGVFWVRKVMCMELDPPPPGINTTVYEEAGTTERQRIEKLTAQPACAGCHKMIDPFGFALENYDALGRWRTMDNGHAIDPAIAVDFLDEGPLKANSPVEALKAFTTSVMFKQCVARQMFRFYMGRNEEESDDPVLRRMFLQIARDDDLLEVLRILAASDRIGRRQ